MSIGIAKKWEKISENFLRNFTKNVRPIRRQDARWLCCVLKGIEEKLLDDYFEIVFVGIVEEIALLSVNNRKYLIETTS